MSLSSDVFISMILNASAISNFFTDSKSEVLTKSETSTSIPMWQHCGFLKTLCFGFSITWETVLPAKLTTLLIKRLSGSRMLWSYSEIVRSMGFLKIVMYTGFRGRIL